jgi:hypothetical protein
LVQANGWQRWFQPSQKRRIAAINSSTLAKVAAVQRLAFDDGEEHLD